MTVKTYKLFIGFLLLMIVSTSCNKLNELPPNTLIAENAIEDEATAETAVNGIYSYFGSYGELNVFSITTQSIRDNLVELSTQRSTYEMELSALDIEPSWVYIKNLWVDIFKVMDAANNVIDQLAKFAEDHFSPGKKTEMLGEARFMRGYALLDEMKSFGHFWDITSEFGPLIRLEPAGLNNNAKARSTVAEGYNQIIEDFRFAADNAPAFTTIYRASNYLAKAYLAESLLMRGEDGDYAEVAQITSDIIDNSPFRLDTPYAVVYTSLYNSSELMFSRKIREEDKGLTDLTASVASPYSLLGRKRNPPTDAYFEYVTPDDTRYPYIIGDATASNGVFYKDTFLKHFKEDGDVPLRFMRLTQMYLYKAEALYRSGAPVTEVLKPLNVLRKRGGMPDFEESDVVSRDDLSNIIFKELIIEIGVENGADFFAAVRFRNSSGDRMIKELNPAFQDDNQLVLPIPDDEVIFNPKMKENP